MKIYCFYLLQSLGLGADQDPRRLGHIWTCTIRTLTTDNLNHKSWMTAPPPPPSNFDNDLYCFPHDWVVSVRVLNSLKTLFDAFCSLYHNTFTHWSVNADLSQRSWICMPRHISRYKTLNWIQKRSYFLLGNPQQSLYNTEQHCY